jgi:hypothetical protein
MGVINSIDTQMVWKSALGASYARGHVQQMQFMLKVKQILKKIACHQESDTARCIRLITFAVFSAGYVLKLVLLAP